MTKDRAANNGKSNRFHSAPEIEQNGTEAARVLQMEILHAYTQMSRSWLARVHAEAALWAELGAKIASSRSLSAILDAHKRCVADQIQMAVQDGEHLFHDCEKVTRHICELIRGGSGKADIEQYGD